MPPKKARISTSDVPAWQRSIAGLQTVCTVASTSTSTYVAVHMLLLLMKKLMISVPSAKKVRVYNFSDKWAKDRPWLEFR